MKQNLLLLLTLSVYINFLSGMEEQSTEMHETHNASNGYIWALSFNDDNKLALGFGDEIKIWDSESKKFIQKIPCNKLLVSINFCAENQLIFTAGKSFESTDIVIWDEKTGKQNQILENYFFQSDANTCSKDGLFCLHSDPESGASIWNIEKKELVQELKSKKKEGIFSLAFSCNTEQCASGGFMQPTQLFDVQTGKEIMSLDEKGSTALAFVSNKNIIISSPREEEAINVWDLSSGKIIQSIESNNTILALACSSDNNTVAYSQAGNSEVNYFTIENNWSTSKPVKISYCLLS